MKWSIPERMIRQARDMVDEGRVLDVTHDTTMKEWYAEVLDDKKYSVSLDGTAKEQDQCQCETWQKKGYCMHTVAVELYLKDQGYHRIMAQNASLPETKEAPSMSQKLLEKTNQWRQKRYHAPQLALTFVLELQDVLTHYKEKSVLSVWLKIGEKGQKMYVVKDIQHLLHAFGAQQPFETPQGNYVVSKETLSPDDYQALSTLVKIYQFEGTLLNQQKGLKLANKMLLLPVEVALDWLDKSNLKLEWLRLGKKIKIKGRAHALPFVTTLLETAEGLEVTITPHYDVMLEHEHVFLQDGYWVSLSIEQMHGVSLVDELLKRLVEGYLFFEPHMIREFFTQLYPLLEKISHLQLTTDLLERLNPAALTSHLTLELVADKLIATPAFLYGTQDVLKKEVSEEYLINRDEEQESLLKDAITRHGFKKQRMVYEKNCPKAEALYVFFTKEYPEYQRLFSQVELSEDLQKLYLDGIKFQPKLQVNLDRSWLDITFNIEGISQEDVSGMMQSLLKRRAYHQLSNGQVLDLATDYFTELAQTLQEVGNKPKMVEGHLRLAKYQSIALAQKLANRTDVVLQPAFQTMLEDLANYETLNVDVPATLNGELRHYQLIGFKWLWTLKKYGFGGILADDMGLGKTIQAITYLLALKETGEKQPSLIISPASLIYNWKKEIELFAPILNIALVIGDTEERQKTIENLEQYDVAITSYSTYRQDSDFYQKISLNTLIMDEAQMVKNAATKTFKAIQPLKTQQRFALSGTPIENKVEELWSLFHLLMPRLLPGEKTFQALPMEEIRKRVQPFVLRRTKKEVLPDLPEKIESTLYSELTTEQKALYLAQLEEMQQQMQQLSSEDFQQQRFSILAGITRLRQICCSPVLIEPDYPVASGKLIQLKQLLQAAIANNRRILVFSQFTSMLSLIETELLALGIESFYLRGSTPGKKRQQMVDDFNAGQKSVFLISLKAGGTGLNLTGADTVILYDLWWNPAVEEQAMGRAHRIGQEKEVEVWRLVAQGTIEEKIAQLQKEKKDLFTDIFDTKTTQLTEQDIRQMLLE